MSRKRWNCGVSIILIRIGSISMWPWMGSLNTCKKKKKKKSGSQIGHIDGFFSHSQTCNSTSTYNTQQHQMPKNAWPENVQPETQNVNFCEILSHCNLQCRWLEGDKNTVWRSEHLAWPLTIYMRYLLPILIAPSTLHSHIVKLDLPHAVGWCARVKCATQLKIFVCNSRGVLAISTSVRVRPPFFFFSDAIVLTSYLVVFAGFVFSHFLSDFKNKYTVAKFL